MSLWKMSFLWWNLSLLNCTPWFTVTLEDSRLNLFSFTSQSLKYLKKVFMTCLIFPLWMKSPYFPQPSLQNMYSRHRTPPLIHTAVFEASLLLSYRVYRAPTFCLIPRMRTISHIENWDSSGGSYDWLTHWSDKQEPSFVDSDAQAVPD